MKNSRWQANKIGLINFWYYDEQEFCFANGNMLLRGSNGSGKSVTMQSVVPLLLDGNMSPERLDPFGSRDRKMSSYLLEEDDERQERTGYLYLEFKREESDVYLTVGMGIRARKGKPLDKWYFYLSDGRRISKDFWLYKRTEDKMTLTKKELEYRLLDGGGVFDRQQDYMEYVNRQIFGFETTEEYKELIDLLIQLRTPKLSRGFKPSLINEILSDSLQPLSDDDLRPMSEAIENMDSMTMNLKARREARQAAEKINRVYGRYNQLLLFQKAKQYEEGNALKKSLAEKQKEKEAGIRQCEKRIEKYRQRYQELAAELEALDKEKESLNASDAVFLKKQEIDLSGRAEREHKSIEEKEVQLEKKNEQYVEVKSRVKELQDKREEKAEAVKELLEEMQEYADDMAFPEHAFLCGELEPDQEYNFDTHITQMTKWKQEIDEGFQLLEQADLRRRQLDEKEQKLDQKKRESDLAERRVMECVTLLSEACGEYKEQVYDQNARNTELKLPPELLKEISQFADHYGEHSDYEVVRQKIFGEYLLVKGELNKRKDRLDVLLGENEDSIASVEEELRQWEESREPEPERCEAVKKNREWLQEKKIPYKEFYKTVEFGNELSQEQCGRLEEALLQMGILDALVIEEQYREAVQKADPGMCDHYLFVSGERNQNSMIDILDLNDEVNDIFFNQRITGILESIGRGKDGITSVAEDGSYRLGILEGTVTRTYEAGYIGVKARERLRQAEIHRLQTVREELETVKKQLQDDIDNIEKRMILLDKELDALPKEEGMRAAWLMKAEAARELSYLQKELSALEEEIREMTGVLQEIGKKAAVIAERLYLPCRMETFAKAKSSGALYQENMYVLKSEQAGCVQFRIRIQDQEYTLEKLDEDMDQIRYDLNQCRRSLGSIEEELGSVREQLKLTNYEEIQDRLDYCLKRLIAIPGEKEACVEGETKEKAEMDKAGEARDKAAAELLELEPKILFYKESFEKERELGYVETAGEGKGAADMVGYLEAEAGAWSKEDTVSRLNQVYFENKGFLSEYQITQTEIFEEIDQRMPGMYPSAKRSDIYARFKGIKVGFQEFLTYLDEEIIELEQLIKDGDRELFEDILANTVSRKIRNKINGSYAWVDQMNGLMNAMNTSSGLRLSLRWRSKTAEHENQLDTKELVDLLKKDYRSMKPEEADKLSRHFRSKVEEARRSTKDSNGTVSFYQVMKDTLDYRKWFEFQLFCQKGGEKVKELTNSVFGTFSGGEKAMAMYVPLFSAVVAKYKGGREDAPRIISLDEAFAGVDNRNIRDMFRLMTEFKFDFIINSQVLWGDCDTLNALAIYQLLRPENAKFVTVMPYLWNGHMKESIEDEQQMEQRVMQM